MTTQQRLPIEKESTQRDRIKLEVEKRFDSYKSYTGVEDVTEDERKHIINVGTSIMCTKWEIPPKGGDFVTAFVDGDLFKSYSYADTTIRKAMYFLVMLYNNMDYVY